MPIKVIRSDLTERSLIEKIANNKPINKEDIGRLKDEVATNIKDTYIPKFYSYPVICLFIVSNLIIFSFILCATYQDIINISNHNYQRFLTQSVIMALIGGTVTQTGLAFYLIGKIYSSGKEADNKD